MQKSLGFYIRRFTLIYALTIIAMTLIGFALYIFAPGAAAFVFEGPGGTGVSVGTLILPPLVLGHTFWKHEGRAMTRAEGWGLSAAFTAVAFALSGLLIWLTVVLDPLFRSQVTALLAEARTVLLVVGMILAVVVLLSYRLMLWSSIRGHIKQAERAVGKV